MSERASERGNERGGRAALVIGEPYLPVESSQTPDAMRGCIVPMTAAAGAVPHSLRRGGCPAASAGMAATALGRQPGMRRGTRPAG